MRGRQELIMTSSATLPVVVLLCIAAWIANSLINPGITQPADDFVLIRAWDVSRLSPLVNHLCSITLYVIVGFMLVELNNRSDILRVKSSVLAAVYLLSIASCPELYAFSFTHLSLVFFLLSLYFLFASYQHRTTSTELFYSFILLSLGTFFYPQLIYFIPIWFIGAGLLQSLHIRSFFGSIIGFALPYLGLLTYALYIDHTGVFFKPFLEITHFGGMDVFIETSIPHLLSLLFFLILFVISAVHSMAIDYDNKIRTRIILHVVIIVNSCLFIFAIIQPMYEEPLLSLSIPGTSLMIAHLFVRTNSRSSYFLFIGSLAAMLICYLMKILPVF
jgi:hypothetical protein